MIDRSLIKDGPNRTGQIVRRLGAFVDRESSFHPSIVFIDAPEGLRRTVAPVSMHIFVPRSRGALLRVGHDRRHEGQLHLVVEALPDLIDRAG